MSATLDRARIAAAVSAADAWIDAHGDMPRYWREHDVDGAGLRYVAMQRALRMILLERGEAPGATLMVALSPDEQARQFKYAGLFLDGFAAATEARGVAHADS